MTDDQTKMAPSSVETAARGGPAYRFNVNVIDPSFNPAVFEPDWLNANGMMLGQSDGRGAAYFFHLNGQDMVLRHYRRGGLVGRLVDDRFLRFTAERSRPMQEFDLLTDMHTDGLPVPCPVAARYLPRGLFYTADLITLRIPNARPLADIIAVNPLLSTTWVSIGAAIKRMHEASVFHSDLNCRNILVDDQCAVWLIDFDKCDRRAGDDWKKQNLDRLQRSLLKEAGKVSELKWSDDDWTALLDGYASDGGA